MLREQTSTHQRVINAGADISGWVIVYGSLWRKWIMLPKLNDGEMAIHFAALNGASNVIRVLPATKPESMDRVPE
jgi:hypothetical protein